MTKNVFLFQNSVRSVCLFRTAYLKALLSKGYSVTIVARADDIGAIKKLEALGCTLKLTSTSNGITGLIFLFLFLNWQYLINNLFRTKIKNCIHFLSVGVMLSPPIWLMRHKSNWVSIEGLGSFATSKFKLKFIRFLLDKKNVHLTFTNRDEQLRFNARGGRLLGGIGVDLKKYHIDNNFNRKEIGYFGRIVSDKGFYDVIGLAREIKKRSLPLSVVIFGEIYPNNPSSLSAKELQMLDSELDGYLKFRGFVENVVPALSTVACLVLPSKREGFPVVVMEASACGVPSICYRVPGCEDAVRDGVNGHLIALGDKRLFIETAIATALASNDRQAKVSVLCREYAVQNFDNQEYGDCTEFCAQA